MEIINTQRLKGYDVTLIKFDDSGLPREEKSPYEVQISKKPYDRVTEYDGFYKTKRIGLQVYKKVIKEIENGEYEN